MQTNFLPCLLLLKCLIHFPLMIFNFFFFLKFNISGGISNHARRTISESTKQNKRKKKASTLDQPSSPTSKYVKETPTETF